MLGVGFSPIRTGLVLYGEVWGHVFLEVVDVCKIYDCVTLDKKPLHKLREMRRWEWLLDLCPV